MRTGGPGWSVLLRSEGIDAVRFVPWDEAMSFVRDSTISDGETVAALMYAALATGRI